MENLESSESEIYLINIEPISDYVNKKIQIWNNNKSSKDFSIEELAKSISIIPELNYNFLNTIINNDNFEKFYNYYKFFSIYLYCFSKKRISK